MASPLFDERALRWDMGYLPDDLGTVLVLTMIASVVTAGWAVEHRRRALIWISISVAVLSGAVLLLWPREPPYVPGGRRGICMNNLRQIGFALMNYEASRDRLPPAFTTDEDGNPLHSWRTLILPYIERMDLFSEIDVDRSWQAARNKKLTQTEMELFHCPSDEKAGKYDTSYVAVVGRGTAWEVGKRVGSTSIKDGRANTILLIELKNSGIKWAEPRDLDLDHLPPGITKENLLATLSNHTDGFNAFFADGSVRFISSSTPWDVFMAMLTIAGGEAIDLSK